MNQGAPVENPFLRVRLRGVWVWVLLSGLALAPMIAIAKSQGWLVPRRDLFLVLATWLYAAPLAWMVATARRHGIRTSGLVGRPVSGRGWAEAVAIVPPQLLFSATSFMLGLALLAAAFPGAARRLLEQPETMSIAPPGVPRPLVALMLVLVAPVAEELLFRGFLLHTLASRWGFRRAAWVTAAVFAVLHANLLGIFVFGLVLTVLYVKFRSLLVPMLCHAVNNLIPLLLSMQPPPEPRGEGAAAMAMFRSHLGLLATMTALSGLFMAVYLWQGWPRGAVRLPYDDAAPSSPGAGLVPETLAAAPDDGSTSSHDRSPSPPTA